MRRLSSAEEARLDFLERYLFDELDLGGGLLDVGRDIVETYFNEPDNLGSFAESLQELDVVDEEEWEYEPASEAVDLFPITEDDLRKLAKRVYHETQRQLQQVYPDVVTVYRAGEPRAKVVSVAESPGGAFNYGPDVAEYEIYITKIVADVRLLTSRAEDELLALSRELRFVREVTE